MPNNTIKNNPMISLLQIYEYLPGSNIKCVLYVKIQIKEKAFLPFIFLQVEKLSFKYFSCLNIYVRSKDI